MNPYQSLLSLPHPVSGKHPPMPIANRAAQFAPFAALTGFEEAVEETARTTEQRPDPTDEQLEKIDAVLRRIAEISFSHPAVRIERFVPDPQKSGGKIASLTGAVRKVDPMQGQLVFVDGSAVPFSEILAIELQ